MWDNRAGAQGYFFTPDTVKPLTEKNPGAQITISLSVPTWLTISLNGTNWWVGGTVQFMGGSAPTLQGRNFLSVLRWMCLSWIFIGKRVAWFHRPRTHFLLPKPVLDYIEKRALMAYQDYINCSREELLMAETSTWKTATHCLGVWRCGHRTCGDLSWCREAV